MKYNIGDNVIIVKDISKEYINKIGKIIEIDEKYKYPYTIEFSNICNRLCCDEELRLISKNNFSKKDLEIADILILRNGNRMILTTDENNNIKAMNLSVDWDNDIINLDNLTNNLKDRCYFSFDIMQVQRIYNDSIVTIYAREDKRQMKLSEIEKQLGYKIDLIKEDE